MTKVLASAFGFTVGILVAIGFFELTVVPMYEDTIAEKRKAAKAALAGYSELLETTQAIIDTANTCVDILWTMPLSDIETVRKNPRPSTLPRVIIETNEKPVVAL